MVRRPDLARGALAALLLLAGCGDADTRDDERPADSVATRDPVVPADSSRPADVTPAPPGAGADRRVADELRAALARLVRGQAADSATWFSARTADIVRSVDVDLDGHAVVDFVDLRPLIPNASSSAGSELLLRQVNATVFSVEGVTSVEYRMAGSCALLGEWLQYGTCLRFDRE